MDKIFCKYDKKTENTYRWKTILYNAPFQVYINKWRVPDPCPSHISVEIFELDEGPRSINYLYQEELLANPELFSDPIVARITYNEKRSVTFMYKSDLNDDVREAGDIFIPKKYLNMLHPKRLIIVINWEKGNGEYHNPTH